MRYTKSWRTTKWCERLWVGVPAGMNCGRTIFPHSTKPITHEGQLDSRGFANGVTDAYQGNDRKKGDLSLPNLKPQSAANDICRSRKSTDMTPSKKSEPHRQSPAHIRCSRSAMGSVYLHPAHREYMAYPRAAALAEVGWSPKAAKNYEDFLVRLRLHLRRLKAMGMNYRPPD